MKNTNNLTAIGFLIGCACIVLFFVSFIKSSFEENITLNSFLSFSGLALTFVCGIDLIFKLLADELKGFAKVIAQLACIIAIVVGVNAFLDKKSGR